MAHTLPFARHRATELAEVVSDIVHVGQSVGLDHSGLHLAATLSHRLMLALGNCERDGWTPDQIATVVAPARAVHRQSPFIKRLQDWPRGYPGDFETVEYLLEQRNRAVPGTLAWHLEQYALDSPIAQQHRNKVALQSRVILETVLDRADLGCPARVLVLAAGSGADVLLCQRELRRHAARVVLLDQDPDALAFTMNRLPTMAHAVTPVRANVVRGVGAARAHGPFDLVVAGGLFDYLPDTVATLLLRQVRVRLLAPGGRVFFTNIAEGNPYRAWMEYMGAWRLLHRTEAQMRQLCAGAGFADTALSMARDRTGLAIVTTVKCAGGHP